MDHEINRFADLGLDVFDRGLLVASHDQIGKSPQRFRGRIRVDCGERTGVPGVEGIQQCASFNTAHLAQNDSVGPPP